LVDIFPTLCELTGLECPPMLEGDSLVSLVNGTDQSGDHFAISQYPRGKDVMGYSMRTDRYRYTVWMGNSWRSTQAYDPKDLLADELYDYAEDPNETKNLVSDSKSETVLKDIRGKLQRYFAAQVIN
jgi:arylsulfatase A-like enzyme